MNLWMNK